MTSYTTDRLHYPSTDTGKAGAFAAVDARKAGWDTMNFAAVRLSQGKTFEIAIDAFEYVAVVLSGQCNIRTNKGDFEQVGRRQNVFTGLPYALYLPPYTEFEIEARTDNFEFASCWVPTEKEHPPKLITPHEVDIRLLGGGNASRQMCQIIASDFAAERIMVYELYTPGGNWSSYPPQKHDTHRTDDKGTVLEAQLNRFSFYKFDRPTGYAYQRVYSADKRSDITMMARQHDVILMPSGYYAMVSAPGTTAYTLNFLAGSTRQYAAATDPDYAWVTDTLKGIDPRLPLVDRGMEVGY